MYLRIRISSADALAGLDLFLAGACRGALALTGMQAC